MSKMFFTPACVLLLLTLHTSLADLSTANPCEDGWVQGTFVDLGCLLFEYNTSYIWEEAAVYCQDRWNATLVEIYTEDQHDFLEVTLDLLAPHQGVRPWWVGGTDIGREGAWYYSGTLQPVPEDPWYKPDNRPSCGLACNCMCILPNYQYYAADQGCIENLFYPICQKQVQ